MDFRDIVRSGLQEYTDHLNRAVEGLTPAELRWQPSLQANHIVWLVWHIGRVEDGWVNEYIRESGPLWRSDGWADRFGLSSERGGYGDTAEDVTAFPEIPMPDLLAYLDAVRRSTLALLDTLSEADLPQIRTTRRTQSPPTVAWTLAHLLVENSQHVGQVAYVRGLLRGLNA